MAGATPATDTRPLAGKRILVSGPEGRSSDTALRVRLRGADPVGIPLLAIGPPPDPARVAEAVRGLESFERVVFTSRNAVEGLFEAMRLQGMDGRDLNRVRTAAIGSATASALACRGVQVAIVPEAFVGEALATAILEDDRIRARIAQGRTPRVLVARAFAAREVVPERLRQGGCEVVIVPVYETAPTPMARRRELLEQLEAHAIDIVLLTSSSAAASLVDTLGPGAAERLQGVLVASIGPITRATAEELGLSVDLTAPRSTVPDLLDALERRCAQASPAAPPARRLEVAIPAAPGPPPPDNPGEIPCPSPK